MYEIRGNNKNQMVNRKQLKEKKKVGIQFQPTRRVEVANNKIRRLTMLIVEEFERNQCSNLEST